MSSKLIDWNDFKAVEMRVGTILAVEDFKEAIKPAYIVKIDFGEYGIKKSSAQITKLYSKEELIGKQIVAVVNFPPKQIATLMSECLILGVVDDENEVTLLHPSNKTKNGLRIL